MTNALYAIRKFLALLFIGIIFIGVMPNGAEVHTVLDEENCKLSAFIASDAHIEGNQFGKLSNFGRMLRDVKNTKYENDAIVFLGDNTMNGQHIENMFFFGAVKTISPAKNTLVALGNHDVKNGEGKYKELSERYIAYNNTFCEVGIEKPYFFKIINGYYFIFLATEESTSNEMEISDEQLTFLRETMNAASAEGKPVFVFNHHPLDRELSGKVGSIRGILNDYKNVFYIYGHMHAQLSHDYTVRQEGNITTVCVPMFTSVDPSDETGESSGVGFQLEAYENSIVFRARNCYDGKWLENYKYTFDIA